MAPLNRHSTRPPTSCSRLTRRSRTTRRWPRRSARWKLLALSWLSRQPGDHGVAEGGARRDRPQTGAGQRERPGPRVFLIARRFWSRPVIAEEPRVDPTRVTDVARSLEDELRKLIVGQRDLVRGTVIALLAGGHVLMEGVPGLGKTVLVRSLGQALKLNFSRGQFTP